MSTPFAQSNAAAKSPVRSPARSPAPTNRNPLSPEQAKPVMVTPKTTPSKPQRTPTSRPSPKVTPGKASTPGRTVKNDSPSNMRSRQASSSIAESPSIMLTSEDEPFWDGDDMTLEMVTEEGEGGVDEEVGFTLDCSIQFADLRLVYSFRRRSTSWRISTLGLYSAIAVYLNVHRLVVRRSYTPCKPRFVSSACYSSLHAH